MHSSVKVASKSWLRSCSLASFDVSVRERLRAGKLPRIIFAREAHLAFVYVVPDARKEFTERDAILQDAKLRGLRGQELVLLIDLSQEVLQEVLRGQSVEYL